ncbi:MAG: hypothetical protein OHK0013_49470 [Sandaracinaceae bacterium]
MSFRTLPDGVVLGPLSARVFEVLAEHTSFPWPIMQAQCRRENIDPTAITPSELTRLVGHLATAVARFASPERGAEVSRKLRALASAE